MSRILRRFNDSRRSPTPRDRLVIAAAAFLFCVVCLPGTSRAVQKSEAEKQIDFGVKMAVKGAWREAAFRFRKAVQAEEDNAMAHNDLAVALENLGSFEEALQSYEKALELDPDNEKIRSNHDRFMLFYRQHTQEDH